MKPPASHVRGLMDELMVEPTGLATRELNGRVVADYNLLHPGTIAQRSLRRPKTMKPKP